MSKKNEVISSLHGKFDKENTSEPIVEQTEKMRVNLDFDIQNSHPRLGEDMINDKYIHGMEDKGNEIYSDNSTLLDDTVEIVNLTGNLKEEDNTDLIQKHKENLVVSQEEDQFLSDLSLIPREFKKKDYIIYDDENNKIDKMNFNGFSGNDKHILFFIDESIKCKDYSKNKHITMNIKVFPKTYNVNLGSRKYLVKKIVIEENNTIFDILHDIIDDISSVEDFISFYKLIQINGIVIHPLIKIFDLTSQDNYIIVTRSKNISLGIDSRFLKKNRIVGLQNLGNTCFMNSALQCILNCKEFIDYFFSLEKNIFRVENLPVTHAFYKLIHDIEKADMPIAPVELKEALGRKKYIYKEKNEQDSVEFIYDLLDIINDELTGRYNHGSGVISSTDKDRNKKGSQLEGSISTHNSQKNLSIVQDLFFLKIKSSLVCTGCNHSRSVYEHLLNLSVPVPDDKKLFDDIILFYESPQKVPLKIFAPDNLSLKEFKHLLKKEYDVQYDILVLCSNSGSLMKIFPDSVLLKELRGTLYCYEHKKSSIKDYYWVKIVRKTLIFNRSFEFNILVELPKRDINDLMEIIKNRLTPFIEQSNAHLLYEKIDSLFQVEFPSEDEFNKHNILERPLIYFKISNWNFKRLFESDFNPKDKILRLSNNNLELRDCIDLFLQEEDIFGNEEKLCESCNSYNKIVKKLDFEHLPKYLILQFKRFGYSENKFTKIETYIDFPLDFVYLNNIKYRNIGFCNHISPANGYSLKNVVSSGHYTSYVKKEDWYLCNDYLVSKSKNIRKENAYVIFLERVDE